MQTAEITDSKALVQDAIKQVTTIATLPEVTTRIVTTVQNPNSTAQDLHKIVAHDPALASRILKVVNSSFYGLPGQIGSIERAIVLLGLNAVKNLAMTASLGQMFRGVKLCEGFTARDLWTHCIAVGVTARELARQMDVPVVEEAFLSGMIHDVGILVSLQVFPEQFSEVCETARSEGGNFCEIERRIIGVDHQQLGAGLAEKWKFPRSCQLVAGYHHRPQNLDESSRLLVTLVYVADTLCAQSNRGFNLTAVNQTFQELGLEKVGLEKDLIARTEAKLDALVDEAAALFG